MKKVFSFSWTSITSMHFLGLEETNADDLLMDFSKVGMDYSHVTTLKENMG